MPSRIGHVDSRVIALPVATLVAAIVLLLPTVVFGKASISDNMPASGPVASGDPSSTTHSPTGPSTSNASNDLPSSSAESSDDKRGYIVVLKDSVARPRNVAERHEENRDAELSHVYGTAIKGYAAKLTPADVAAVRRDPTVAYVERDFRLALQAQYVPTGLRRVYAHRNINLDIDGTDDVRVDADIAILDTIVDEDHPDLNVVSRIDCTGESYDPTPFNCDPQENQILGQDHGTHVAGIAAAVDNGIGVVGTAPGARIWGLKVAGSENGTFASSLIAAVNWVTQHASTIEVANMSVACVDASTGNAPCPGKSAAMTAAIAESVDAGVVYVAAAGNSGRDPVTGSPGPEIPAAIPDVIAVSAITDYDGLRGGSGFRQCPGSRSRHTNVRDQDDTLAWYSNRGPAIDIAAPGTCIMSTVPVGRAWNGGSYAEHTGTSMASPHIAGAAAVLAAEDNPNNRQDVEAIRAELIAQGNQDWTDNSGDGHHEKLLDMHYPDIVPTSVTGLGVASHIEGAMDLYARKPGGLIGQINYNPFVTPAGWMGWGSLSIPYNDTQPIEGSPAVISRNKDSRDVFVTGTNHALFFRNFYSGQGWGSWYWIASPVDVIGSPAATVRPGNGFDVVIRGSDNKIYQKTYSDTNGWSVWKDLGSPPGGATSAPATATRFNQEYVDVMVRGTNNSIWHKAYHNGAWTGWVDLGGASASAPALTATRNTFNLYLFVRRADNRVWYRKLPPYSAWTAWKSLSGQVTGDPAATSRSLESVDVFAVGGDQRIYDRRFVAGGWTNWMRIEDNCPPGDCTWKPLATTSVAESSSIVGASGSGTGSLATLAGDGELIDTEPIVSLPEGFDSALSDGEGEYLVDTAAVTADELLDLVTVGDDGAVRVYPGVEDGGFDEPVSSSFTVAPVMSGAGSYEPVAVADVNGDEVDDLIAFLGPGTGKVEVHLGSTEGTFAASGTQSLSGLLNSALLDGSGSYFLDAADVSGDGFADLVAMNTNGVTSVYRGQEDGKFAAPVSAATIDPIMDNGSGHEPLGLGDVDGDGRADLLTLSGQIAKLYRGQEGGSFATATTARSSVDSSLLDGAGEDLIGLLDYNRDGYADLVSSDAEGDLLTYAGGAEGILAAPEVHAGSIPTVRYTPSGLEPVAEKPMLRRLGCSAGGCLHWPLQANVDSDVDGDLEADLVSVNSDGAAYVNGEMATPKGTADPALYFGDGQYLVDSADVTGDGRSDLVTMSPEGEIQVRRGKADGDFNPDYAGSASSYVDPVYSGEGYFEPIAAADVDGDGHADVVGLDGTHIATLAGDDDGTFDSPVSSLSGSVGSPTFDGSGDYFLDVIDVTGDGHADLVSMNTAGSVRVYKGQSSGGFLGVATTASINPILDDGTGQEPVGLGDVNLDGRADLVTLNGGKLKLHLGNSDGTFATQAGDASSFSIDSSLMDASGVTLIGMLDISDDGRSDIVMSTANGSLYNYVAQSNNTFASASGLALPATPPVANRNIPGHEFAAQKPPLTRMGCVATGCRWPAAPAGIDSDVNGDRRADLTTIHSSGGASVFLGDPYEIGNIPTEDPIASLPTLDSATQDNTGDYAIDTADVTGDKISDLVTIRSSGGVYVYPGSESGAFGSGIQSLGTTKPVMVSGGTHEPIAVADVTGDGYADLINFANVFGVQTLLTYKGQASGAFVSTGQFSQQNVANSALLDGSGDYFLEAADVTGDGLADLTAISHTGVPRVFAGQSSGQFAAATATTAFTLNSIADDGKGHEPLGVADVDRDLRADLVVLNVETNDVLVFRGLANGTFALPENWGSGPPARDGVDSSLTDGLGEDLIGLLDINRDRRADLVSVSTEQELLAYPALPDGGFGDPAATGPLTSNRHNVTPAHEFASEKPAWRRKPSVVPTSPTASWSLEAVSPADLSPADVSCTSTSHCIAVGEDEDASESVAALWSGTSWSAMSVPDPEGATASKLNGVSCLTASDCTAVGSYRKEGATKTLAMRWDGSAWSIATTPNAAGSSISELAAVSCTTASFCLAVGSYDDFEESRELALLWNGSSWSLKSPGGSLTAEVTGVACWSPYNACTTVGSYIDPSNDDRKARSMNYAFGVWTSVAVPEILGATEAELSAIACLGSSSCRAVGSYINAEGKRRPLAVERSSSTWALTPSSSALLASSSHLRDVSCASASSCVAVGTTTAAGIERSFLQILATDHWLTQPTPSPAGAAESRLGAVSCVGSTDCRVVGEAEVSSAWGPYALRR